MDQQILRYKQLTQRLRLSRSTIHRLIAAGDFVTPIRLSPHAVGFIEADVAAWVANREAIEQRAEA